MAPFVAFRVTIPSAEEDRASGILWDCETLGIEIRPAADPDAVELFAYFEIRPGLADRLAAALGALPALRIEPAEIPDVDWVAHVREGFQPVTAGGFRILPVWQAPPAPTDPSVLIVDPGRAFGTGGHETTRLCLASLQALAARGRLGRVLDLGAGSGILAIAALRLGAEHATALDLDPDALESAAHHARLNAARPSLLCGDGGRPFRPTCFDVVVANLTAPLLCARQAEILALLRPEGTLIVSGFLVDDVPRVREAYSPAGPARSFTDGEWAALLIAASEAGERGA